MNNPQKLAERVCNTLARTIDIGRIDIDRIDIDRIDIGRIDIGRIAIGRIAIGRIIIVAAMVLFWMPSSYAKDPNPDAAQATQPHSDSLTLFDSDSQLEAIAKPQQLAIMHLTKEGIVANIFVREGERVEAGQALVSLDLRGPQAAAEAAALRASHSAEITIASLAIDQKRTLFNRTREAMKRHAASAFELESKQAELQQAIAFHKSKVEAQESAKLDSKIAAAELTKYTLAAPFRGIVLHLHKRLGNSVNPTAAVVTIGDLDSLEFEMHLPITLFGKITAGDSYRLACSAPVSQAVTATAAFISPILDPTSETFRVRFVLDNRSTHYPAGFTAHLLPL